jgi:tight adherence protein C
VNLPREALALLFVTGTTGAVVCIVFAVGRSMVAGALAVPRPGYPEHRALFRVVLQWVSPLGAWVRQPLPARYCDRLERRLLRADLDEALDIDAALGLVAVPAVVASTLALLAALAGRSDLAGGALLAALTLAALLESWLRRRVSDRERRFLRDLPAYLDVLTVCVEAGVTLAVALRLAVEKAAPSPARRVFARLLHEIRMGRSRVEALQNVARLYELEALSSLVAALIQSEGHGMGLGTVLRAQSQQRATERQLRAEKAAMKAPVKMLGPLVLCVFPCTFVVIAVPVLVRMFLGGG